MDDLVASAIAHWGPRFTANGVAAADFARITAGIRRWDDWCAAWTDAGTEYERLGRDALAGGRHVSAGELLASAAVYHHFGKFVFVQDREQMRAAHARAVDCLTDALPHLQPPGRRIEIGFEGSRLVGVLRAPTADAGPAGHPLVIMIPGLDSTKEELRSTEQTFLDRGLATFSVDGPGQGEAEYDLPIRADWSSPAEAIVAALAAEADVDLGRLAVWGVSLGGYYAPRVAAALGDRIRACVALAGPFDFGDCWDGLPELTKETFLARSGAADRAQAHEIAGTLSLERHAGDITAPLLIVFGRNDRLIPWSHAERLRDSAGAGAGLLMLDDGNHGCANRAAWHRPYTADWLTERLSPPEPAT